MKYEYRVASEAWPDSDIELRADESDGLTFRGYAAVFDSPSEPMWGFNGEQVREVIRPGAFDKSLSETATPAKPRGRDVKMFWNHDQGEVLASTRAGTLRLDVDAHGLRVEADLPDSPLGQSRAISIKRGDASKMSFGFNPVKMDQKAPRDQQVLTEVRLWEVSPVSAWPAYQSTSASVRHLVELAAEDPDDITAALREYTPEQLDTLLRALRAVHPTSQQLVSPDVAARLARLDRHKSAA
ncbi:MAG: HK97 family phage prohead protease [Chloroflexi bacterium]|nr:HK97 family phage prohead protease [Chloroflexota bacterium]